jgi:hypothetical protein
VWPSTAIGICSPLDSMARTTTLVLRIRGPLVKTFL